MTGFHSPKRAKQLISFAELGIGKMRPTDIDFMYELKNKGWVIGEVKRYGAALTLGQRILLERLGDQLAGLRIAFFARHNTPVEEVVPLSKSLVEMTRRDSGAWEVRIGAGIEQLTVKELIEDARMELKL